MISPPNFDLIPDYCRPYISYVSDQELIAGLILNRDAVLEYYQAMEDEKWTYAYAEGKWTCGEMLAHLIQAEYVFTYRSMRFSHFDATPLPGFDEDAYMDALRARNLHPSKAETIAEFLHLRNATIATFSRMNDEQLDFEGTANGRMFTARIIGYMTLGHATHHLKVMKERY